MARVPEVVYEVESVKLQSTPLYFTAFGYEKNPQIRRENGFTTGTGAGTGAGGWGAVD